MIQILLALFLISFAQAGDELCQGIVVQGKMKDLDETEKRLVCGDKESIAYKKIPAYEAQIFFTAFLQSRGQLEPKFEIVDEILYVKPGKKFFIKKIQGHSPDPKESHFVKKKMYPLYKKKLLTPKILNKMEFQALGVLRNRGFPCSTVEGEVATEDSIVQLKLNKLNWFQFGEVDKESVPRLEDNALDRFYPFKADDPFKGDLLTLTEKRMMRNEVVQGTYFIENCSNDAKTFSLEQKFIVGPPRTIRYGAGASTELGPFARIKWSNNRFGPMASQLSASLQSSFRSQSLNLTADQFLWKRHPRRSLLSQVEVIRESQYDYKQTTFRAKPHMKWSHDGWRHKQIYTLGPSYEASTYNSKESSDTKSISTGYLEGSLEYTSHIYELFDVNTEDGDVLGFNFDLRHPSLGFPDPLLKLDSTYVKLGRLMSLGNGSIVGGVRLNAGSTWVSNDVTLKSLPPSVKFFGGGSDDIRGFLLKTLPKNDGLGALTRTNVKFELRRTALFIEKLEGYAFIDNALFGEKSFSTAPRLWTSPGLGLRWLSPIGLVQAYVARALVTNPSKDFGNFFYAGFGGGF